MRAGMHGNWDLSISLCRYQRMSNDRGSMWSRYEVLQSTWVLHLQGGVLPKRPLVRKWDSFSKKCSIFENYLSYLFFDPNIVLAEFCSKNGFSAINAIISMWKLFSHQSSISRRNNDKKMRKNNAIAAKGLSFYWSYCLALSSQIQNSKYQSINEWVGCIQSSNVNFHLLIKLLSDDRASVAAILF